MLFLPKSSLTQDSGLKLVFVGCQFCTFYALHPPQPCDSLPFNKCSTTVLLENRSHSAQFLQKQNTLKDVGCVLVFYTSKLIFYSIYFLLCSFSEIMANYINTESEYVGDFIGDPSLCQHICPLTADKSSNETVITATILTIQKWPNAWLH